MLVNTPGTRHLFNLLFYISKYPLRWSIVSGSFVNNKIHGRKFSTLIVENVFLKNCLVETNILLRAMGLIAYVLNSFTYFIHDKHIFHYKCKFWRVTL